MGDNKVNAFCRGLRVATETRVDLLESKAGKQGTSRFCPGGGGGGGGGGDTANSKAIGPCKHVPAGVYSPVANKLLLHRPTAYAIMTVQPLDFVVLTNELVNLASGGVIGSSNPSFCRDIRRISINSSKSPPLSEGIGLESSYRVLDSGSIYACMDNHR